MPDELRSSCGRAVFVMAMISILAMLTAVVWLNEGAVSADRPSSDIALPFVWRDVALVCLLSTMPAAWMLGNIAVRCLHPVICLLIATFLWCIFWFVLFSLQNSPKDLPAFPTMVRLVASLCITAGIAIIGRTVITPPVGHHREDRSTFFLRVSCCLMLMLAPVIYVNARSQYDAEQFLSLREQWRYGEARWLLIRMLMLDPLVQAEGKPLKRERRDIEHAVESLSLQVQQTLPATADLSQCLKRARELAMLGHTKEALRILPEQDETLLNAEACCLLGTIYENRLDWDSAIRFYAIAQTRLQAGLSPDDSAAESYQVALGTAYCYRRLGKLSEAREQYLRLLRIDPSADTHFLLAQFFEDIQDTKTATHHTQMAMKLAPSRYQVKGQTLIAKMQSLHFGCFSIAE